MRDVSITDLREFLRAVAKDAEDYFDIIAPIVHPDEDSPFHTRYQEAKYYWDQLPEELRGIADALIGRLFSICAVLAETTRSSPLTGSEDLRDVKIATKAMRAALQLRRYSFNEADAIHDEGTVLGFRPAEQYEDQGLSPEAAKAEFLDRLSTLGAVLKLVEVGYATSAGVHSIVPVEPAKYRAGTAFIMMWMDPKHPELMDVADTVRAVFRSFEVRALRADDIEHEGLISERVLNEIRTSEFLFADLTGIRPNVYYEVGYAHALGKRVILFRKSGTGLHFDLAGYNCPEYENLRDLREKLTKRLVGLTNRNPATPKDI